MAYTSPEQKYRTSLRWHRAGGPVVSGFGATQEAADEACVELIRDRFRGTYTPLVLFFRNETRVVWRDGNSWCYGYIRGHSEPSSVVMGNWTSREAAEREARREIAMTAWDEHEEESDIIENPDDQVQFTQWARRQKTYLAQYRCLRQAGWTDQEAHQLFGGLITTVDPARVAQLGNPMSLLRERERTGEGQ